MSRRKRIQDRKARKKKEPLDLAGPDEPPLPRQLTPFAHGPELTKFRVTPGQPIDYDLAAQAVGEIDYLARSLRSGAEPSLRACLERVDPERELLGRLEMAAVDTIPRKLRGDALRAFHCALWTGLARKSGFLDQMMKIKLVGFGIERYGERIPQVRPVAGDVPSFHYLFLAVLQDVVKDHLKRGRLIPKRFLEADFLPPGSRSSAPAPSPEELGGKNLPPEEYYVATWEALVEFLGVAVKDGERAEELARDFAPYVFMWTGSSGLLGDIINGLIGGNPVTRKRRRPGGGFEYVFEKNVRGPGA